MKPTWTTRRLRRHLVRRFLFGKSIVGLARHYGVTQRFVEDAIRASKSWKALDV